ncbi:hypothetical protein [Brochothrix thermosphacta]
MGETFTKAGEEAVTIGTIHAAAKRKEKKLFNNVFANLNKKYLN